MWGPQERLQDLPQGWQASKDAKRGECFFFQYIFRVWRHCAVCLGTADSCTENQQPRIIREKDTSWKDLQKKVVGTFVRTHTCGDAHDNLLTYRRNSQDEQAVQILLLDALSNKTIWIRDSGMDALVWKPGRSSKIMWKTPYHCHDLCRAGDIVILGLQVKQQSHWVARFWQMKGFFNWAPWKLNQKIKYEHNCCSWTETPLSREAAPFALFAKYPVSFFLISHFHMSAVLPGTACSRQPRLQGHSVPAGHGARAARGCASPSCTCHGTNGLGFVSLLVTFDTHRQAPKCPAYSNTLHRSMGFLRRNQGDIVTSRALSACCFPKTRFLPPLNIEQSSIRPPSKEKLLYVATGGTMEDFVG